MGMGGRERDRERCDGKILVYLHHQKRRRRRQSLSSAAGGGEVSAISGVIDNTSEIQFQCLWEHFYLPWEAWSSFFSPPLPLSSPFPLHSLSCAPFHLRFSQGINRLFAAVPEHTHINPHAHAHKNPSSLEWAPPPDSIKIMISGN